MTPTQHNVSRSCPVCEAPLGANDGDYCQSCTYEPDVGILDSALCQAIRERDELRKRVAELEERPHLAGACPSCEIGLVTDAGQELVQQRDAAWVERDALRTKLAEAEIQRDELADALGCVNEHSGARQQPCFAEMVEMVWRMRTERDDLMGERELLRCRVAETETEVTRGRNAQLPTLRDQVAMAALHGLLAAVQFNPDQGSPYAPITAVSDALAIADAFLKERGK